MANINSVITYNANLSPAQAQIRALTGQIAGLTAAFNTLNKTANATQRRLATAFAADVGNIGGFTTQMVAAQNAVETFGKQLAANRLTMREYFREAIAGYTKQNSLMQQLAERQVRYQQSVAVPVGAGQTMMLTPQTLAATGNAAALASAKFAVFNKLIDGGATAMLNWGKNTQWAGRQLMVGFTVPLAMFTALASKQFRDLDKELTRFQKVYGSDLGGAMTDATARMRDQVQALAYDISKAYGIAAKDTAALAADIAATGQEGQALLESVQQTTRLAVLGEVDRQEAMKATLSLQSAFRMNTDELAESINFLNAVENQTSATLEDLATAIPKVGPVVRSLGGDVKDLATLLVAMREGGIPAAEAANALKSGLASLINPTKQASEVAKKFGVDLVGIVNANQGQLMPTIFAMKEALSGLDSFARAQIIEQIFGKYQFARITALFDNIGRMGSQTQAVLELASKSTGELAAIANGEIKTLTESTAVKFQRTMEELKNAIMPIGQTLTETLIPILSFIGDGIKAFSGFFANLPGPIKDFAKLGVAIAALAGPIIMLVGLFGNLIANGVKFGMMVTRLGARMMGIKVQPFELLNAELMAAKLGVDNLTGSFTSQEAAMRRLVGTLIAYEDSLQRIRLAQPQLFIPNTMPGPAGRTPIRRQKGSTSPEKVPGGYGGGDKIPALLEPGESVVTKEATAQFWPVIEAMNRGSLPGFMGGAVSLGLAVKRIIGSRVQKTHTTPSPIFTTDPLQIPQRVTRSKRGQMAKDLAAAGVPVEVLTDSWILAPFNQALKPGAKGVTGKILKEWVKDLKNSDLGPAYRRAGISASELRKELFLIFKDKKIYSQKDFGETVEAVAKKISPIFKPQYDSIYIPKPSVLRENEKILNSKGFELYEKDGRLYVKKIGSDKGELSAASYPLTRKNGGIIPGYGGGDIVATRLEPGEFVITKEATRKNRAFLEAINSGKELGRHKKGISSASGGGPALLEPGEFVVNSEASRRNANILHAMNKGTIKGYQFGRSQNLPGETTLPSGLVIPGSAATAAAGGTDETVKAHLNRPITVPASSLLGLQGLTDSARASLLAITANGDVLVRVFSNLVVALQKTTNSALNTGTAMASTVSAELKSAAAWEVITRNTGLTMQDLQPTILRVTAELDNLGDELIDDPRLYQIVETELTQLASAGDRAAIVLQTLGSQYGAMADPNDPRKHRMDLGAGIAPSYRTERTGTGTPVHMLPYVDLRQYAVDPVTGARKALPMAAAETTGPNRAMQDPMAKMMRGQGLMNVAFMGSMLVSTFAMAGAASEDLAAKLSMLSMAIMALPMLQMLNPKGMATNFLGLGSLGKTLAEKGAAKQAAIAGAAPIGTRFVPNSAQAIAAGGPKFLPFGSTAGSGLLTAGRIASLAGGPIGIGVATAITGVVAAYMLYKNAADEARERAIASFEDPAKSAEYFGETIDDLGKELEDRKLRFSPLADLSEVDQGLRDIVKEEYAPLIERVKYATASDGARQLALAYNNMIINGLSAENAKETLKAIAVEAGTQGGQAYGEAFVSGMTGAENVEDAIQKQLDLLNPEKNKQLIERLQQSIPQLESQAFDAMNADAASRWKQLGIGFAQLGGIDWQKQTSGLTDFQGKFEVMTRGLTNVWEGFTGQLFDSTPEAQAADAAANMVEQTEDSINDLKQLSAEAFAASTEDFMKAYEDAPQKVIEAIQASSMWLDASTENVDLLKQKLMELNPVLAGLIAMLQNPEEISLFYQLMTVGADPTRFFDENGFNKAAAEQTIATIAHYDQLRKNSEETFGELKENTIKFIDEEIKATNKGIRKVNDYWDSWAKVTRKEQRQAQKDYDQAQRRSEKFIETKQDEIEAIQDSIDERRDAFEERMQEYEDERKAIEDSSDAYIKSLQKNQEADSFYAQQRKTSLSALEKLAGGDVFGFLQEREQMSADAQQFSYDEMISGIEDRRDAELKVIEDTMEAERRRQDDWEEAQSEKIEGINDLIDAENELMDQRTKNHEKEMRQFEKRQKTIEINRRQDLKDDKEKLRTLQTAREDAETLELADYEKMTELLGKAYEDRYGKQIIELQKTQYYIRLNDLLERNANADVSKRLSETQLKIAAFTQAFGQKPRAKVSIDEQLAAMGMFPYGPGQGGQAAPGAATGGYVNNGTIQRLNDGGGGKVTGPGGPKSDVIPALLSNGEYVIQASSVGKYGKDMMDNINAGKFASGGIVGYRNGTSSPTWYSADRAEQDIIGTRGNPTPPRVWIPQEAIIPAGFNAKDPKYIPKGKNISKTYYFGGTPTASEGYTLGGKKWEQVLQNTSILGYSQLDRASIFDKWRNLRRTQKEQLLNVINTETLPTAQDLYNWQSKNQTTKNKTLNPRTFSQSRYGGSGIMPMPPFTGLMQSEKDRDFPWWMWWLRDLRNLSDPNWTPFKSGGFVRAANGMYISADRAEQAATGTRGKPKPQYSGGTPTYTSGYTSSNTQSYSNIYGGKKNESLINYNKVQNYDFNVIDPNSIGAANAFSSFMIDALRWMGAGAVQLFGGAMDAPSITDPAANFVGGESYASASGLQKTINAAALAIPIPSLGAIKSGVQAGFRAALRPRTVVRASEFFPDERTLINTPSTYLSEPPNTIHVSPRVLSAQQHAEMTAAGMARRPQTDTIDFSKGAAFWQAENGMEIKYHVSGGDYFESPGVIATVRRPTTSYDYPLVKSPAQYFLEDIDSGIIGEVSTSGTPGFSVDTVTEAGMTRRVAGEGPGGQLGLFDITHRSPQLNYLVGNPAYSSYVLSLLSNASLSTKARFGETLFADTSLSADSAKIVDRFMGSGMFRTPEYRQYNNMDVSDYSNYTIPGPSEMQGRGYSISQTSPSLMRFFSTAARESLRATRPSKPVRFTLPFTGQTLEFRNRAELETFLDQFNRLPYANGGLVQKFANGGLVQKFADGGEVSPPSRGLSGPLGLISSEGRAAAYSPSVGTTGKPTSPKNPTTSLGGLSGPNGWPYGTVDGGRGFPLASGVIPGTSVRIQMNKDVLPLFLAFASDYNKLIRPIQPSITGAYRGVDPQKGNISNHPSGTALDTNWNQEGSHYSIFLGSEEERQANYNWWMGKRSDLAPWKSISPVPYKTMNALMSKYKVLQWFGPAKLGGPSWLDWTSSDPMHVQINQDTDPSPQEIARVTASLGINPDGTFNRPIGLKNGGVVKAFASGGMISGPGGPTSDLVPIMASNGEYVVKSAAVNKYGKGFMDQLNAGNIDFSGAKQYASGGMIGVTPTFGIPQMETTNASMLSANVNNNYSNASNSSVNNSNKINIVINGAGNKSANAIANKVVSMINQANNLRDHSRSAG